MGTTRNGPWLKIFLGGIVAGVVFAGAAAAGMRYTDQRPFCASCHIMGEAARSHKMGTHANLACNDCHAPQQLMSKIPFKAAEGLRDFMSNVKGNDVPSSVSLQTKDVVNSNCKRCHAFTNKGVASMEAKPYCVDCHRSNAHMRSKPISTRMVADE